MMTRALAFARLAFASLLGLLVVLAATGWLYRVQPTGTLAIGNVADALPLDELSRRSTVPLTVFLGVWLLAALALGAVVRFARTERLGSAIILAVGIGGFGFLAAGVSLLVVRQVPAHDAFVAAARLRSVYVPAVLAGLAGAVFGRPSAAARKRMPLVLSWLTAAVGVAGIVDGILPWRSTGLFHAFAPQTQAVANVLAISLSVLLLALSRSLARRKRRAWQLVVGLLAASVVVHLFYGASYGAAATAVVLLALVARRRDFDAPGDPAARPRVVLRLSIALLGIFAYGFVALWVNRVMADQPFTLGFALRETGLALVGAHVHGSPHVVGDFGGWFPPSVFVLGLLSLAMVLGTWLAPWRHRVLQGAGERDLARALVARWGIDTLAPFVLRADKAYFFAEDQSALLAYRVVGGIAIVSGDPVGQPDAYGPLVQRFIEHAHAHGWRVAILGASERCLELYRRHGLQALYHGDEAVLDVASFSLDGRAMRKVRQSVTRLQREGYRADIVHPSAIAPEQRATLEAIAAEWRGGEPEKGFVMAFDDLFPLEDEDALFVIGRNAEGAPEGFLHFAVSRAGAALSLSTMPRRRATPNGFNEWLVSEAAVWARENGFGRMSLNFAPFAALLAPEAELSAAQRLQRRALLSLKGHFQLDNLLHFNRKFFPAWQRRFVVYERRSDLPRVGIAALAAEAYLPLRGRSRTS